MLPFRFRSCQLRALHFRNALSSPVPSLTLTIHGHNSTY